MFLQVPRFISNDLVKVEVKISLHPFYVYGFENFLNYEPR